MLLWDGSIVTELRLCLRDTTATAVIFKVGLTLFTSNETHFALWRNRSNDARGESLPELPSRLVYSLLKPAVRVAARAHLPMGQVLDLLQLAYFEELRRHHPRELNVIAERLELSLRTVSTLSRRLKEVFFAAETRVQPARRIAALLQEKPRTLAELKRAAPELGDKAVKRALDFLRDNSWVDVEKRSYKLSSSLRSYIDETITRRIDGLNNQMEILAASVWQRFMESDDTAIGRSWVFSARPEDLREFLAETVRKLRHSAIDLEESALSEGGTLERFGITVAFASVEKKP